MQIQKKQVTLYLELWWLHMKAQEKIAAFMFFSVVMQFVYSLEKNEFGGGGGGWLVVLGLTDL